MKERSISIIGTGALGSVLARSFDESEWQVKSIYNRSLESAKNIAEELGIQKFGAFPTRKQDLGQVIFLTVPDGAIQETSKKLAALDDDFSGYIVVHCSGNKTSSVLKSVRGKGAQTASFHPIQTFVSSSVPSDFEDIFIDVEGQNEAIKILCTISNHLGSNILEITPKAKYYLHAASVMASNYIIALMESAGKTAALGGLDKTEAQKALLPLMQKSIANISNNEDLPEALSGPVARGDIATVADHLELLEQDEQLLTLYKNLGEVLVQLVKEDNRLTTGEVEKMTKILSD